MSKKVVNEDFEDYFDRIICPYCGEDVTDYFMDDNIIEPNDDFCCPVCGGVMQIEIEVDVKYKTIPLYDENTQTDDMEQEDVNE